jgi:hypothetical protein
VCVCVCVSALLDNDDSDTDCQRWCVCVCVCVCQRCWTMMIPTPTVNAGVCQRCWTNVVDIDCQRWCVCVFVSACYCVSVLLCQRATVSACSCAFSVQVASQEQSALVSGSDQGAWNTHQGFSATDDPEIWTEIVGGAAHTTVVLAHKAAYQQCSERRGACEGPSNDAALQCQDGAGRGRRSQVRK